MNWIESQIKIENGVLIHSSSSPESSTAQSSSSSSKITPAVLIIIVTLAVVFFISGLLHLLVRFLIKHRSSSSISESNRYPEISGSDTIQRQLQQLFNLHDSGLDQASIDALPVFHYKEIMGLKEPFDCAICLHEFSQHDKLRLLPLCSHAFHIDCIDTWLLSNSTCPLCRGTLLTHGLTIENPVYEFENHREEDGVSGRREVGVNFSLKSKPLDIDILTGKRVFSVRLGKYKSLINGVGLIREVGETSSSNLDARRCYSMGSYQYVVADSELQVALCPNSGSNVTAKILKGRNVNNGNSSTDGDAEGKRINIGSKGESFSVSKIWLWSKKGKFSGFQDTLLSNSSVTMGLPSSDRIRV